MYRAKEHGRNNFQFYTAEMNDRVNERLALESSAAPRARARGVPAALPAEGRPARGRDHRRRGAGALDAIRSGAWCARRASSRSPRRPASSCRSASGCCARPAGRRARGATRGSSPGVVSVNLSARQFRQDDLVRIGVAHPRGDAPRPGAPRAGAHREHGDAQRRRGDRHAAGPEGARRAPLGGRLRHRLLEPHLPEAPADRRAEDRPLVRARHRRRRRDRRGRARAGDHLARPQPAPQGGRRGRRDRRAAALPQRHGCDEVQGFLYGEPVAPEAHARLLESAGRKGKRA